MDAPPVQYVRTSDGYDIACTDCGEGRNFVFMPPAVSNVQMEWGQGSPFHDWVQSLSSHYHLVCYDGRGQGLSTRGLRESYSIESILLDLKAVLARFKLHRVVLMGSHASGHAAIRFAAEQPERVEAVILISTSLRGDSWPVINTYRLAQQNWDYFLSSYFASTPFGREPLHQTVEYLNRCVHQDDWVTMARAWSALDVSDCVQRLRVPTLVLHPANYINMRLEELQSLAAGINGARFMLIEGSWSLGDVASGMRAIASFLADVDYVPVEEQNPVPRLTGRESEVLRLIAAGRSNQQIADDLVLSLRTVERHITNLYAKIGARGKADATAYALRHGIE